MWSVSQRHLREIVKVSSQWLLPWDAAYHRPHFLWNVLELTLLTQAVDLDGLDHVEPAQIHPEPRVRLLRRRHTAAAVEVRVRAPVHGEGRRSVPVRSQAAQGRRLTGGYVLS